jgi:hypothetical protein
LEPRPRNSNRFDERGIAEFQALAEKLVQPPLLAARRQQGVLEGSYHATEF